MQTFELKYKRKGDWFWKKVKNIAGLHMDGDAMVCVFADKSKFQIPDWQECYAKTGKGFPEFENARIEEEKRQATTINKNG